MPKPCGGNAIWVTKTRESAKRVLGALILLGSVSLAVAVEPAADSIDAFPAEVIAGVPYSDNDVSAGSSLEASETNADNADAGIEFANVRGVVLDYYLDLP